MNRKRKLITLTLLLFTLFLKVQFANASGTVVGNGGDPVFEFMEAARHSMVETVKVIINDPAEKTAFCESKKISEDQVQFCRHFFQTVALEIIQLNQGNLKTPFVLRAEPLYVVGSDGKPMIVAARTQLGKMGPIELHRDSVKTMMPTQVLFLITHEFQHKVVYDGKSVSDNERIGPFGSGRDLIDAVSSALVAVARRKGKVGSQFGIRDIFDCRATVGDSQFGARISTSRLFLSENLMSYESSIGRNPADGSIFVPVSQNISLALRVMISEPNNCGDPVLGRKTIVQVVRAEEQPSGTLNEEVIESQELLSNPMCPGSDPKLEISSGQVRFQCQYYGSEGTTSSPWSLRNNVHK